MKSAEEFLKVAHKFKLGEIPTERPHPKTHDLSLLAQKKLGAAIQVLKSVDVEALETSKSYLGVYQALQGEIARCWDRGGRVFLGGCGATGRLSLSLECMSKNDRESGDCIGFMAGGDVALVHALEGFEDFPEYGARHLEELGFSSRDLFVGSSEGGETPYVIGATAKAAEMGASWFLYCNPTELMAEKVARSRQLFRMSSVVHHSLFVGPMALTGSTRMQASTILQMAIGLGLFFKPEEMEKQLEGFLDHFRALDLGGLENFIIAEANTYSMGEHVLYCPKSLSITVFTDTTERAPTFSLTPFSSPKTRHQRVSLCYVILPECGEAEEAWCRLLGREPRSLNWPDVDERATPAYMESFDFSQKGRAYRQKISQGAPHREFTIEVKGDRLCWSFGDLEASWPLYGDHELFHHLQLKMQMNTLSTLIMGRMGRYKNNLMTWVTPTNGKLIDRATRYVLYLLNDRGIKGVSYEDAVRELFRQLAKLEDNESVVLKTLEALRSS